VIGASEQLLLPPYVDGSSGMRRARLRIVSFLPVHMPDVGLYTGDVRYRTDRTLLSASSKQSSQAVARVVWVVCFAVFKGLRAKYRVIEAVYGSANTGSVVLINVPCSFWS
jgi:hypothetical protein